MPDQTAMQRAFKENAEREPLSPVDEAAWFFKLLGLKQEQLFVHDQAHGGSDGKPDGEPLPTEDNPNVKSLASRIDVAPRRIRSRLPLLALPDSMQRQVDREDGIPIQKAEALARLRL